MSRGRVKFSLGEACPSEEAVMVEGRVSRAPGRGSCPRCDGDVVWANVDPQVKNVVLQVLDPSSLGQAWGHKGQ